jgi:hypothetical protein
MDLKTTVSVGANGVAEARVDFTERDRSANMTVSADMIFTRLSDGAVLFGDPAGLRAPGSDQEQAAVAALVKRANPPAQKPAKRKS